MRRPPQRQGGVLRERLPLAAEGSTTLRKVKLFNIINHTLNNLQYKTRSLKYLSKFEYLFLCDETLEELNTKIIAHQIVSDQSNLFY